MHNTPALHPQSLELPNRALDSEPETGAPMGVKAEDVVKSVPCTGAFDPTERRAYGGVFASKLAGMADTLVKHRLAYGFGPCIRAFCSLTEKLQHALYIYTRVKDAMAFLHAPEEIDIEMTKNGEYLPPRRSEPEISDEPAKPKRETYVLDGFEALAKEHDLRGTSLNWIERRVRVVKSRARKAAREAYLIEHGIETAVRPAIKKQPLPHDPYVTGICDLTGEVYEGFDEDDYEDEVFEPTPMILGEIWPPVPVPTKVDTQFTVVRVQLPRPDKDILSRGRRLGVEQQYYSHYHYGDIANMWTGEAGVLRDKGPP